MFTLLHRSFNFCLSFKWSHNGIDKLKVIFQSTCNFNTLFRYKDTLEKKICSKIVYQHTCNYFHITYYDKTYCNFLARAAWHMGNLTDHLPRYNFLVDFDYFDSLSSDANKFWLLIKKNLLIKIDQYHVDKTIKSFVLKLFERGICR